MRARAGCGTVQGYNRGCKCSRCRSARLQYQRRRWAAMVIVRGGTPQWKVPTMRSRAVLADLRAAGWSLAAITRSTGLAPATLHRVRREPWCYSTTERALLELARR